ncbi:MAG TPA: aldehyde ferredoxin oxidoreductase family protein [Lacipirellulaceae bacterium]|jgi:aldehyde:ferredoxin oxidoreductase|nr:aldehyde ferredoxin oxidoreductase family protein [Lacipirellulaceae bacterium]
MAYVPGYHGCYLRIDLTNGSSSKVALDHSRLRSCIGGSGLGVDILLSEGASRAEPLSPAAVLAFVFSPLVGSPLTTSAKFAVVSKSPLTERINDSLASSGFALAGKKTGHDAIVLTGKAPQPSVLVIDDDKVALEPAGELWGRENRAAQERLRHQLGADYQIATIGPAGERLVRYATISHDGRHAGRGGSGAVLGSKNIKAIAVRGSRRTEWAQPKELVALAKQLSEKSFGPATAKYRELGTATNLLAFNRLNVLPTRNFQQGSFAGAQAISPEQLSTVRERTRASCAACTIGCEHLYGMRNGDGNVRLEYENLFALGPLCGIDDPDDVLAACERCDELGLDTISAGGTIAFAMECAERGYIEGPWLRFGDGQALLRALDLIVNGEGLGRLLAEGSRRMALTIGRDTIDFAPQVKGLEIPGYDPRGLQTMALGFAVGTRGADHNRSGAYEVDFSEAVDRRNAGLENIPLAIETENKAALMDSLILCKFLRGVFSDFYAEAAEMLQLVTGWDVTADELRATAARIVTAKKRFNIEAGWTPAEDTLPARMLTDALPEDARARLAPERLATLVQAYNAARGWTPEGWLP